MFKPFRVVAFVLMLVCGAACGGGTNPGTSANGSLDAASSSDASPTATGSGGQGTIDTAALIALVTQFVDPATGEAAITHENARTRDAVGASRVLGDGAEQFLSEYDEFKTALYAEAVTRFQPQDVQPVASIGGLIPGPRPRVNQDMQVIGALAALMEGYIKGAGEFGKASFHQSDSLPRNGANETGKADMRVDYSSGHLEVGFDFTLSKVEGDGADQRRITDDMSFTGAITPCPDAGGGVTLNITFHARLVVGGPKGRSTSETNVTTTAAVTVSDEAEIANNQVQQHVTSSTSEAGLDGSLSDGGSDLNMSFGMDAHGIPSDIQVTDATVDGQQDRADGAQSFGLLHGMLIDMVVGRSIESDREVWRNDKCVTVDVTPGSQDVELNEELNVEVKLKHRVTDEELHKKVKATLEGVKKIDPPQIDQAPGTFTYTAGPLDGDKGTVTFKSTSNRGIGTKIVTYTVHSGWNVSIDGHLQQNMAFLSYDLTVTAHDVNLVEGTEGELLGTGDVKIHGPLSDATGTCTGTYDTTERVTISGTVESNDESSTLTLKFQFPPGSGSARVQCGPRSVEIPIGNGGGFGQRWGTTVGDVTVDAGGETLTIDKQGSVGGFPTHATGTLTVTPK